ncbi:cell division protein FtsX [Polaribacter reichenbachii]|uniref:Cell division protein FtsX n=1 Tax=Polaribacter reichenbachii TaxID=996801 RepID=A0A1B8TW86_9FLAO|nr:ABC transporter permease [Polaribacter reichenbachii]APZ45129.1 cell division protein FtsX [Polaribacter reichenbachii]AUC18991.1 cell division protein FtsX [Polaribacter reichenbachii]OBY63852.1 cell division protein FtsX [Polaribacter reichenbachii]
MFKNYIKIAFRNIMNHKVFSFINVIGLTIGFSASFIIGLMVYYDYTFDDFHKDGDRIYRVVTDFKSPEGEFFNSGVTLALKGAIQDNSNFDVVSEFYLERPMKVNNRTEDLEFKLPKDVIYADENYFKIFDYKFIVGNNIKTLQNPNEVILTEERASKYFPNTAVSEIIGKTLVYNDSINAKVTGIVESFKNRTDIIFQEFISHPTLLQTRLRGNIIGKRWNNTNSNSQLYVKLSANANKASVKNDLKEIAIEHRDEDDIKYGEERIFNLQPLNDIHFNDNYGIYNWSAGRASKALLKNLVFVAVFLLLLGCINFINLNTAQAAQRAKEIGIRKTLGSSRNQLISQFMGETFLLVLVAALLSLILSKWLIIVFSDFVPVGLSFELFTVPIVAISIIVLLVLVTFLSGFYPAMVLSKINTISVLKNHLGVGDKKVRLRKFLTVFQFTIAQVFIIATLLVGKQINFLLNKDMGFKKDAIVSVYKPLEEQSFEKIKLYSEKLASIPNIKEISLGGHPPASQSSNRTDMRRMIDNQEVYGEIQLLAGDTNYLNLFEIDLLAGRVQRNDTIKELVINEAARKFFRFKSAEDAIGKSLLYDKENLQIVGVIGDFHQRSLKSDIKPLTLHGDWYRGQWSYFQAVHISLQSNSTENLKNSLSKIENVYKEVYPNTNMRLEFLDETIAKFYKREQKVSKLLNWATGLSILISCLGLLGLVIYTTNRRVKEIGVRKVLGASLFQINALLCREFLSLVLIAFALAAPIAWYGTYNWLQNFAYKTNISFWVFVVSAFAMIVFALIIISAKTLQAANANPVNSLRSE